MKQVRAGLVLPSGDEHQMEAPWRFVNLFHVHAHVCMQLHASKVRKIRIYNNKREATCKSLRCFFLFFFLAYLLLIVICFTHFIFSISMFFPAYQVFHRFVLWGLGVPALNSKVLLDVSHTCLHEWPVSPQHTHIHREKEIYLSLRSHLRRVHVHCHRVTARAQ